MNPGAELRETVLRIAGKGTAPARIALGATPAQAVFEHEIWIPAPSEDREMEFEVTAGNASFETRRLLNVPAYRSLFDRGTFEIDCTNHNDLGFLSTQKLTADYRSSALILPAMDLMRKYPEFLYSMECTTYLMEFLERHPERRDEMAELMRQRRFIWAQLRRTARIERGAGEVGAPILFRSSMVEEELPRRGLTLLYPDRPARIHSADAAVARLRGRQILSAGPHAIRILRLAEPGWDFDPRLWLPLLRFGNTARSTDSRGWLRFADEREPYYTTHRLPRRFIYDYTSDYLPPQPEIVPYVRRENARMQAFAKVWNANFPGDSARRIDPPRIAFTTPEKYLDALENEPVELPTLRGEWPMAWAYYDEPSNREALLDGRHAHNDLLAAERAWATAGAVQGFAGYPADKFQEAWRALLWPDHGWGGNRGLEGDRIYADSYAESRRLAVELLAGACAKLAPRNTVEPGRIPVTVFNPLSWLRTDLVEFEMAVPAEWPSFALVDDRGREVPCVIEQRDNASAAVRIAFIAKDVPPIGCRSFAVRKAEATPYKDVLLAGEHLESRYYTLVFGPGGIKRLYDKASQTEVLRTSKFDGGEILQFTASGLAWEDPQAISMAEFDRTSNHEFPIVSMRRTPIGAVAVREAKFKHFRLRQHFRIYDELPRVDTDIELLDWDGAREIELRAVFPVSLDEARLSYETPFGAAELGKDEIDFTRLPSNAASQFYPQKYGGDHPLAFRQAINWIDASSPDYANNGVMAASDTTVHLFRDPTAAPVGYPVLQHVLLASRKSLAWNPPYWFTQKGTHRYRTALLPHAGGWRERYRDAIGFNNRLSAFVGTGDTDEPGLQLEPHSLVLTAFKKSEDDNRLVIRFYEAEGNRSHARLQLRRPIRRAWRVSLIEDEDEAIPTLADGSIGFPVKAWEIVTLKLEA